MTDWTLDWRIYPWASFNSLIDAPPVTPDASGEQLSLCINRQYLPYLLGAIAPLTFPDFYNGDSDAQALAANYFQQVWFMLLTAGECPLPFDVRQNEENPCILEKSEDGGATWTPFADLTHCAPNLIIGQSGGLEISTDNGTTYTPIEGGTPAPQPTPPEGQSQKCIAAQNGVNVMVALYQQTVTYFNDGVNVIIVVTGVISLIAIMLLLPEDFPFALTAFTELWGFMTTIVAFEFSSDDQKTFLCDLLCAMTIDGAGVASVNFTQVVDAVDGRWGLTEINQWTLISYLLQIIGSQGLNASLAVQSATTADCTDCPCNWCYDFDFTASEQGFTLVNVGSGNTRGHYVSGQGWAGEPNLPCNVHWNNAVFIERDFGTTSHITQLRIYYTATAGTDNKIDLTINGSAQPEGEYEPTDTYEDFWTGNSSMGHISVQMYPSTNIVCAETPPGSIVMTHLRVWGEGDNPFGEDNC